jgi:RNA polymerase sigma-70 factor (ECF subfamily)
MPAAMDGRSAAGLDDRDMVARILDGDVDAFAHLMDRYRGYVLTVIKRHAPAHQVEDLAQETFVKAFQSLGKWRQAGRFRSWLAAIAVRTCYDYWRRYYRSHEVPMSELSAAHREWLEHALADASESSWQAISQRREARAILDWALQHLSAADRMVLELVYLEERPVKEAARLLGWTVANVKVRSFRARRKLNKLLLQSGRLS